MSLLVACCTVLIATEGTARPAMIVGGSGLLTQLDANQIETWLGEGSITLTNIYTKAPSDSALDFHAAVDNKGRTIMVIEILEGLAEEYTNTSGGVVTIPHQIIGGYNPQSWRSDNTYSISAPDERDAFIFNLTTGEKQDQLPFDGNPQIDFGQYQTFNDRFYGPLFGSGFDIGISFSSDIGAGGARNYSYGSTNVDSIVWSPNDGYSVTFGRGQVGRMEVYTIQNASPSAVPEPSSVTLFGLGFVGLAGIAIRRRAKQTPAA